MTIAPYLPARQRHCDVLRAIASGCTRVKGIKARMPGESYTAIHTSLTFLRNGKYIESSGTANGGHPAEYTLIAENIEWALEQIMPTAKGTTLEPLDPCAENWLIPVEVWRTLAGQHGVRVVVGLD